MSKEYLIKAISKDTGLSLKKSKLALNSILSNIMKIVAGNNQLDLPDLKSSTKLRLVGFGTFEKVIRKPRTCRNPQTGEEMKIGERAAIKFKPSTKFKELL